MDCPENSHVVFCPNKERSFEGFSSGTCVYVVLVVLVAVAVCLGGSGFSSGVFRWCWF